MKLIARKNLRYATRQLKAGDEFDATDMHARVLVGARLARHAPAPAELTMPTMPPLAEPTADKPDIDKLRATAEQLGIEVDRRWGAARLQQEIDQAI